MDLEAVEAPVGEFGGREILLGLEVLAESVTEAGLDLWDLFLVDAVTSGQFRPLPPTSPFLMNLSRMAWYILLVSTTTLFPPFTALVRPLTFMEI